MRIRTWQFIRDGNDLYLTITRERPWWKFWQARFVSYTFSRLDAVAFYQSLYKEARALMVQAEHGYTPAEEFEDDVRRSIAVAIQESGADGNVGFDTARIAHLLSQKGYTKA